MVCGLVLQIELYSIIAGVIIIDAHFTEVVTDIKGHDHPAAVLVIDELEFSVVFSANQDVVFLGVHVTHHQRLVPRQKTLKVLLVVLKKEKAIDLVQHLEWVRVRDAIVLEELAAPRRQLLLDVAGPLVDDHVEV